MKIVASFLRKAGLPQNVLIQFPSKDWGFVGNVYKNLMYVKKDGSEPTQADFDKARQIGTKMSGLKVAAWKTPLQALEFAKKHNQTVTITEKLSKDNNIMNDLEKSKVKYVIN